MLNALEVTVGDVKTPIFIARHVACHGIMGPEMEFLVSKINRFLSDVRAVGPRRSLAVEETVGWQQTQEVQPLSGDPAYMKEFDIESYRCRRHLQDLATIVEHAMPVVAAWLEWGNSYLVPDELGVRWLYEPGIANRIAIPANNRDGQSVVVNDRIAHRLCGGRSSQAVGVPSHPNVEFYNIGSSSWVGTDAGYTIATEQQLEPVVEEGTSGSASVLRYAGVPEHIDTSYLEHWGETPYLDGEADANHPPYLQRTTDHAMGVDQRRSSSIAAPPAIIRPPWVCCAHGLPDPVLERWYDLMEALPVDESGLLSAIALAHYDPRGYAELAGII